MITVEFKDLDDMVAFARRVAADVAGRTENGLPASTGQPIASAAQPAVPAAQNIQPAPMPQAPTAPVQPAPQMAVPPVQPAQSVPTTAASYTADDLAIAAMALMDSGHQQELISLLQSFGVAALPELKPEQYGVFATALRGLGAKI